MDEREKRQIGEQVEPGGRPKAPGRLELLQRFINTHNHDFPPDWDRLETAAKARAWLGGKGLLAAGEPVSEADAARLRQLREALRALVVAGHGGPADGRAADVVRTLTGGAHLAVVVDDDGRTALVPTAGGVDGAV